MSNKNCADLSSLVTTKGQAVPIEDMPTRNVGLVEDEPDNSAPLNFRVTADLRRRFRMFAAAHDLKLNELLRLAFEEYEKRQA